jgi:hypothetical protein
MSNLSEQNHLDPNDPAYYAPRRLRERAKLSSPLTREAGSEPFKVPLSSTSLEIKSGNFVSDASRRSLTPPIFQEPVPFTHEARRAAMFGVGALFVVGAVAAVAMFFFVMAPGSRQSEAASTPLERTGSITPLERTGAIRAALPEAPQESGTRPALAEFQAIITPTAPVQNAAQDQSELLQRFLQWKKPNATEKPR